MRARAWLVVWPVAALLQCAAFFDLRHDDAFITFRYAQNLASGHGMVFNPGEHLMGSTSPGHVLLSALVYSGAGLELTPSLMAALGCIAWTAQAGALFLLLRAALDPLRAAMIAACVLAGGAASWQWVALETNLALATALFALLAAEHKRWSLAALLLGLAALLRADTLILATLLLARGAHERRAAIVRPALIFLGVTVPWLVFAQNYFGSVIPQSLRAKLQRSSFGEYAAHVSEYLARTLLGTSGLIAQLACVALVALGSVVLVRARLAWLLAYGALHLCAYLVLRTVAGHDWHLYPSTVIALVAAVTGGLWLCEAAARSFSASDRPVRGLLLASGIVLACAYGARSFDGAHTHARSRWNGARDQVYRAVAAHIRPRTAAGERFAAVEVGTLAYYSQLNAFDLGMLVSDRKQRPREHIRWVVLDDDFLLLAPAWPAIGGAEAGDLPKKPAFHAYLFAVPNGTQYFDILHERLAQARARRPSE